MLHLQELAKGSDETAILTAAKAAAATVVDAAEAVHVNDTRCEFGVFLSYFTVS